MPIKIYGGGPNPPVRLDKWQNIVGVGWGESDDEEIQFLRALLTIRRNETASRDDETFWGFCAPQYEDNGNRVPSSWQTEVSGNPFFLSSVSVIREPGSPDEMALAALGLIGWEVFPFSAQNPFSTEFGSVAFSNWEYARDSRIRLDVDGGEIVTLSGFEFRIGGDLNAVIEASTFSSVACATVFPEGSALGLARYPGEYGYWGFGGSSERQDAQTVSIPYLGLQITTPIGTFVSVGAGEPFQGPEIDSPRATVRILFQRVEEGSSE